MGRGKKGGGEGGGGGGRQREGAARVARSQATWGPSPQNLFVSAASRLLQQYDELNLHFFSTLYFKCETCGVASG
jgi:hypothetical protein